MSRLIDADALKTDLTRFYDNEVTAKRLIDEQPTIDAIPVRQLEYYNDTFDGVLTIGNVLKTWKDKRFPFFSDHGKGECNEEI